MRETLRTGFYVNYDRAFASCPIDICVRQHPARTASDQAPGQDALDASSASMLVTRKPICEPGGALRGYELAIDTHDPEGTGQSGGHVDPACRALHMLVNVVGLDTIASDREYLFIPATTAVLTERRYLCFPEERTVLIVETPDSERDDWTGACAGARERGYRIAMSHDWAHGHCAPPGLTSYVRAPIAGAHDGALASLAAAVHRAGGRVVALGVDDEEGLGRAVRSGVDLVQGRSMLVPRIDAPREIEGVPASHQRLLAQLGARELDRAAVARTIESDVALCHALLLRVNSAAMGLRKNVSSVVQALTLLGDEHVRAWGSLAALVALKGSAPSELVTISLVRARLCSTLAAQCGRADRSPDAYFVGLFSTLDALVGMPMERAATLLPLPPDVVEAIMGGRTGPLGGLLKLAEACECGAWTTVRECRDQLVLPHQVVVTAYYEALNWARSLW